MTLEEIINGIWELGNRTWHEYPFSAYCAGCDADISGHVHEREKHKPDCEVLALVRAVEALAISGRESEREDARE